LREIFRAISPAPVLITIHLSGQFDSQLGKVLSATRPLTARFATDGEPMQKSRIYIAPQSAI
jgi:chemotaxis response regulator CheB